MDRRRQSRAIPAALALLAFVVAFVQRPGDAYPDSRVEMALDPSLFLDRIGSVWSSTVDLGHVHSGQFVGYLFPMGSWYALADLIGIPVWVAQRLWLGALVAVAAWGVVRLMDELFGRPRGVAHLVAGLLFAVNPYVVLFTGGRGTVTLLAYAALPWLLLAVHNGLRDPRGWRWPIVCALLIAAAGGGVNAAVVVWVLLAPVGLLAYEAAVLGRGWAPVRAFGWRTALCAALVSLWWLLPVLLQGLHAPDFLEFTEQPASIWATTSLSESLRLLGYWLFYFGFGFGYGGAEAFISVADRYLFSAPVIVASFLVPLFAFGALRWTRSWSYASFFSLLAVASLLVMAAGFPEGTILRKGLTWGYYNLEPLQFLRTSYKAAPVLALSIACLGGAAAAALVERARAPGLRVAGSRLPPWALAGLLVVPVLWALPLFSGSAISRELAYGDVPGYWRAAVGDAERTTPRDRRVMVLPGELFGWYRWGGTWDSVAPGLSDRPVVVRQLARYADPRSSQLQTAVDDLVQQSRLVPGQLGPLLGLMGIGQVLVPTDGRRIRTGALDPAGMVESLAGQEGFDRPLRRYGATRAYTPLRGRGGERRRLPDIRAYATPGAAGPGIVRVHDGRDATVLDGDGSGIAELAAVGGLHPRRALLYAGDADRGRLRDAVGDGAELVFTDSNRRRILIASRLSENQGPTLGPRDPIPDGQVTSDPFPGRGTAARTVAVYSGLRYLRTPQRPGFTSFPQHRAYAAIDGDRRTSWVATSEKGSERYVELALTRPRRVGAVRVYPHSDRAGRTVRLGVSVNGGSERAVRVRRGWNRVAVGDRPLERLRLRVLRVRSLPFFPALGGIAEIDVPGLRVTEALRLPTRLAAMTGGLDLSRNAVSVLLQRTTADFPYRAGADRGDAQAGDPVHMLDVEPGLVRDITLPVARSFALDGWASVDPSAPDPLLDRLAGLSAGWRFASSSRFEGVPRHRASSAFDGDPSTAWVADRPVFGVPRLSLSAPRAFAVRRIRLVRGPPEYGFPSRVRVSTSSGSLSLRVQANGAVELPRRARTRTIRIDVLRVRRPRTPTERRRRIEAVSIAEVRVPGLRAPAPRRTGSFASRCGELVASAAGSRARARVTGTLEDLDAGRPLRIGPCGRDRLRLPAGTARVNAPRGAVVRPDHLRLRSPPPVPRAIAPVAAGTVIDPGDGDNGRRDRVRLSLREPGWLVLGESYSKGWRAWCRDERGRERSLGGPTPVDGFANGWRVGPDCRTARFRFAPQRLASASYAISALAVLALLGLLALGRGRRAPRDEADRGWTAADPLRRLAWGPAIAVAAVAAAVGGVVFALRAGAVIGPVLLILLRDGVNARRLLVLAAVALAAVPLLYLAFPAVDQGGFNFAYANEHIEAHWAAVAAVCCLAGAAALDAWALRSSRRAGRR